MNNIVLTISARLIQIAREARDRLYRNGVTDPKEWEKAADLLKGVGFSESEREARKTAAYYRKQQNDKK